MIDSERAPYQTHTDADGRFDLPVHPGYLIENPWLRHDAGKRVTLGFSVTVSMKKKDTQTRLVDVSGLSKFGNKIVTILFTPGELERAEQARALLNTQYITLGEAFGMAPGSVSTGKMVSALRALGFDRVFDTDFAADLTIMEETTELIGRLQKGENLPILTSCCPGWVKFFEHQFPDLMHIPSSAKSPQQMFGAIAKSYYAEKLGISPDKMVVVSIMPCLAKKHD